MLASVRPRDVAARTRRRVAAEALAELIAVDAKIKKGTAELKKHRPGSPVTADGVVWRRARRRGPSAGRRRGRYPVSLCRPEPVRVLDRDRTPGRLLRRAEPAPAVPGREPSDEPHDPDRRDQPDPRRQRGRTYYRRKRAEGKKPMEAVRCLKRRISDAIYRHLVADQQRADPDKVLTLEAGPGGHCGASHISSAAGSYPHTSTSDQPLPGPAQRRYARPSHPEDRAHNDKLAQPPLDNRRAPEFDTT